MKIIYEIFIITINALSIPFRLFSKKIDLFHKGRKDTFKILKKEINPNEKNIWFHVSSLGEFEIASPIIEDLKIENNDEILLFVNGMGGTPLTELYLLYDNAKKTLDDKNIKIARSLVGNYCTSLEMQGASLTITKLDQELKKHWDSPVHTAAMRWGL